MNDFDTIYCSTQRRSMGEMNDCTVVAAALATGLDYDVVHKAFEMAGRKHSAGCNKYVQQKAYYLLGYEFKRDDDAIERIHARYKTKKFRQWLTLKQAKMDMAAWNAEGPMLVYTKSHVSYFDGNKIQDWADGRSTRVLSIYKLEKID